MFTSGLYSVIYCFYRILCGGKKLKEIDLDLHIDDQELITCCGLREMVRFLSEVSDCNSEFTGWKNGGGKLI